MSRIRLGEPPFLSIQGEGIRTGVLSVWVRLFGCNLDCSGFGQCDPADKSTYILPQFDLASVNLFKTVMELPVFKTGCDSGYSWSHVFKHLASNYASEAELVEVINGLLYNREWISPKGNSVDLCFTGGEPMMQQKKIISIYDEITKGLGPLDVHKFPQVIQIETNGTQELKKEFIERFFNGPSVCKPSSEICWNISPKLFYVSGEPDERAWFPDIIESYAAESSGHLKFVINNDDRAWDELNRKVDELHKRYIFMPTYVMPVGATKEQQEDTDHVKKITERAIKEGYHVTSRIHCTLLGNSVGV